MNISPGIPENYSAEVKDRSYVSCINISAGKSKYFLLNKEGDRRLGIDPKAKLKN
jgi:hypothetical protein